MYENHLTNITAGPVTLYDDSFHTLHISISKPTKHFSLMPLLRPSRRDPKQHQPLPIFSRLINAKIHLQLPLNDIILFQINHIRVTQLHRLAGTFLIHEVLPDMEVSEESSGSALWDRTSVAFTYIDECHWTFFDSSGCRIIDA